MEKTIEQRRRVRFALAVGAVSLAAAAVPVMAGAPAWVGGANGNWNTPANWTGVTAPFTVPTAAANDTVSLSGGVNVNITDPQSIQRFTIGSASSNFATSTITSTGSLLVGGILTSAGSARLVVGNSSSSFTSVFSVEAGGRVTFDSNTTGGGLSLALNDFSRGTAVIAGTVDYTSVTGGSSNGPYIGVKGVGTLTINSGASVNFSTTTTASQIEMGFNQGATSILNVNGGVLTANFLNIRNVANAANPVDASVAVNIAGGQVNINSTSAMFTSAASTGKLSIATLNLSGGVLSLKAPLHASSAPQTLGAFNWSGGRIVMSQASGTATFATPVNLAAGGTGAIFDTNGTTNTISGSLTGGGSFTKTGAGLLTISGSVSNTGGLAVTGGTLSLTNANNSHAGGITVSNATLLLVTGASGTVSQPLTLQEGARIASSVTGGNATVANSVTVTGNISVGGAASSTGRITFSGPIDLAGGTRTFTVNNVGSQTPPRAIDFSNTVTNGNLTLAGATGTERVRFSNPIGFGTTLTLQNVTLTISTQAAFAPTANVVLNAGGVLDLGDPNGSASSVPRTPFVATLASAATGSRVANSHLNAGIGYLNLMGPGTTTFAGTIVDGVNANVFNALNVWGGQLTLTNTNTYTGPTGVVGGKLILAAGATISPVSPITVDSGGVFDPTAAYPAGWTVNPGVSLTYNGGTVVGGLTNNGVIRSNTTNDYTLAKDISGTGAFAKDNTSTVTLTGVANYPAGFTVSGGTAVLGATATFSSDDVRVLSAGKLDVSALPGGLQVAAGKTAIMNGPIVGKVVNNGTVTIQSFDTNLGDATYPADISGSGSLTKTSAGGQAVGTSTLTGALTFTGDVSVSAGALIVKTPLRPVTGSLVVAGPGASTTLDATGYASSNSYSVAGQFASISVGSNGQTGVSTVALTSVNRTTNKPAVLVTSGVTVATDGVGSYSGFVDLGNGDMIVRGGAGSIATLRTYLAAWLASGSTKVGIGSSAASPTAAPFTTVSLFSNDAGGSPFFASYDGVSSLAATDVILKYTYVGDTNLDGKLDGNDLANVIEGYSNGLTGWANGDFDHSGGTVTVADLAAFQAAYAYFTTPANNAPNLGDGSGLTSTGGAIPEPGAVGLILAGAPVLTRRRRR